MSDCKLDGRRPDAYGWTTRNGRKIRGHRAVWEDAHGPIPEGLMVLHSCDTPGCRNLKHLRLGTHEDNAADAIERGQMARGERHGQAKLTEDDVRGIRRSSLRLSEAAARWGVSKATILKVRRRETWTHVED